jgi:hypothetical protein
MGILESGKCVSCSVYAGLGSIGQSGGSVALLGDDWRST